MNILVIDGGGIRGLIPAKILQLCQEKTGFEIKEYFDLIAGTSTGGIIAKSLGYGYTPAEIHELYHKEAARIFSKNPYSLGGWVRPKYNLNGMLSVFREYYGEATIAQQNIHTIAVSYDYDKRRLILFDSKEAEKNPRKNVKLYDAVTGTAAAPSFFPSHRFNYNGFEQYNVIDGGAAAANNPIVLALAEALKTHKPEEIKVLSIGTGIHEEPIKTLGNIPTILKPVIESQMDGSSESGDLLAGQLLGKNYLRLQFEIPKQLSKMDNIKKSNLYRLSEFATHQFYQKHDIITKFFDA